MLLREHIRKSCWHGSINFMQHALSRELGRYVWRAWYQQPLLCFLNDEGQKDALVTRGFCVSLVRLVAFVSRIFRNFPLGSTCKWFNPSSQTCVRTKVQTQTR